MKWKTKRGRIGDERERIIFALWPRICEDGYTRWLERVLVSERYVRGEEGANWEEYAAKGLYGN